MLDLSHGSEKLKPPPQIGSLLVPHLKVPKCTQKKRDLFWVVSVSVNNKPRQCRPRDHAVSPNEPPAGMDPPHRHVAGGGHRSGRGPGGREEKPAHRTWPRLRLVARHGGWHTAGRQDGQAGEGQSKQKVAHLLSLVALSGLVASVCLGQAFIFKAP